MAIVQNERIYGNKLGFTINGQDYWADCTGVEISEKEGDSNSLTFADYAAGGGRGEYEISIKAVLSTASKSLWMLLWEQRGRTLSFIVSPHGNKTASAEKPHFKGKMTVSLRPPISLEAGDDKARSFDITYKCVGPVEKVTSTSTMGTGNMEDNAG